METTEHGEWTVWGEGPMRVIDWPNLGEAYPNVLRCPTCGLHVTVFVDTSAGSSNCVEDCPLCCHPIGLHVTVENYKVTALRAARVF